MKKFACLSKSTFSSLKFAIPSILTVILGKYLFETLAFDLPALNDQLINSLVISDKAIPKSISLLELKARLLWLTGVLLYIFVNLGFFSFLWGILKKNKYSEILTLLLITSFLIAIDLIYILILNPDASPLVHIFHFNFDTLTASGLLSPIKLSAVKYIVNIVNFIAIIMVPFSIIIGCCIVKQKYENLAQVNKQFLLLKDFINGASAIMVVGIIHMQLWLSWPLSLTPELANLNNLKDVIATLIQYWGIFFTLTIAALYLPIAAHLRSKAYKFINEPDSLDNNNNSNQALYQSATSKLPQIAALLSPMLVGSVSPALASVFSG